MTSPFSVWVRVCLVVLCEVSDEQVLHWFCGVLVALSLLFSVAASPMHLVISSWSWIYCLSWDACMLRFAKTFKQAFLLVAYYMPSVGLEGCCGLQ